MYRSNLVLNGNFAIDSNSDGLADNFSLSNVASYSLIDGVQSFLPSAQYGTIEQTNLDASVNDILYARARIKTADPNVRMIMPMGNTTYLFSLYTSGYDVYEILSGIGVVAVSDTSYPIAKIITDRTSGFSNISLDYFFTINLTSIFGSGAEPTNEWCDNHISYTKSENKIYIWDTPITDRTEADVISAISGQSNIADNKGAWNISDANRIIDNTIVLRDILISNGYNISFENQTHLLVEDLPYVTSVMRVMRDNIMALVNGFYKLTESPNISYASYLNYTLANNMELNLSITNTLLENMILDLQFTGEPTSGEQFYLSNIDGV